MGEMQALTDAQLLHDYAANGSEAAFRELVARHTDFVYSAALRQVESSATACDLAQSVFTDLARKAPQIAAGNAASASLAGWLHRSTRFAALNHLRDTRRRLTHERQAMEQLLTDSAPAVDWEQVRPVLDEALDRLPDDDREALLLRYFQNQDLRSVGQTLGVSDDAAQKRVSRAVERLREFFAKRGVTVGAGGLAAVIAANAVQAAPAGLALTISTAAALGGPAIATTATAAAIKTIAMTTLQKSIVGAMLAAAIGTGIYEARQVSSARAQIQTLVSQREQFTEQIGELTRERDDIAGRLAVLQGSDSERLNGTTLELLRLRAEVSQWRRRAEATTPTTATNETDWADATLQTWRTKLKMVKQRFDEWPGKKTPELLLLTEADWMNELSKRPLDTEEQVRETLSALRFAAKCKFEKEIQKGLTSYDLDNPQQFPSDLGQLAPYLSAEVQPMLAGYEIAPPGKVHMYSPGPPKFDMAKKWALVEKGAGSNPHDGTIHSDPDYDWWIIIYPGGHAGYGPGRPAAAKK